ncbi:MAG: CapA family protein, partial [Chromatiaceae bacterium]|nr:CapA family protein [Chromatiaceae bacterium]
RQLTPALRDVDIFGFNLESAITTETSPWGPWKKFRFKALPANARRALSFPTGAALFASVANNHILDFGPSGLDGTLTTLDEAGITHTGAGSNSANAWRPAVITTKAGVRER